MPIYLEERFIAESNDGAIGFPSIWFEMAVVAVANRTLWGMCLPPLTFDGRPNPQPSERMIVEFGRMLSGYDIYSVYTACNTSYRYGGGSKSERQKRLSEESRRIAGRIRGLGGALRWLDTEILTRQDGTYLLFERDMARLGCKVFYKRAQKVKIRRGQSNDEGLYLYPYDGGGFVRMPLMVTYAGARSNFGNQTVHEVDYNNRFADWSRVYGQ